MNRSILTELLKQYLTDLNPTYTGNPGTHEYETVMKPLLDRFGSDPIMSDPSEFVRSSLQAAFPDMENDELSTNADIVGVPFEALLEVIRRELRITQITSSIAHANQLTTDELEALLTATRVERTSGKHAIVTVRLYFSTPRFVSIPLNSIAFTTDGKEFGVQDFFTFQPDEMVDNREGEYYYVEAMFVSSNPGKRYNIAPEMIRSVSNVPGLVYATNKFAGEYGSDEETIPDYIERIKSEISERAPDTKRGIQKMVEDTMGSYEVHPVGKGDVYMFRDVARWILDTEEVKITLFNGDVGTFQDDSFPLVSGLAMPWTNRITAMSPEIPVFEHPPTHIVLDGNEYAIVDGTFDSGLPVTDITFRNYSEVDHSGGTTDIGSPVGGGARIAHPTGVRINNSIGLIGGDLWLWVSPDPFGGGPYPAYLEHSTIAPGELFRVQSSEADGMTPILHLMNTAEVLRRSYAQTYVLRIDNAGAGVINDIQIGTYDPSTSTFTKLRWDDGPELPIGTMYLAMEYEWAGNPKKVLFAVAYDGLTDIMSGSVVDPAPLSGYTAVATFDGRFTPFATYIVAYGVLPVGASMGTTPVWTLYTVESIYPANNPALSTVVIEQLGPSLLDFVAGPNNSWSVRRSIVGEDIKGSLLLPSGETMDTEGDIPLGGCTDVYMYSPPSTGRSITLEDFPDIDVVLEGADMSWDDLGAPTGTRIVVVPGSGDIVNVGDVVVVDHVAHGGAYLVLSVPDPAAGWLVLDHWFTLAEPAVPFSVHRVMRASLSESTKIIHSGSDAKTGLTSTVLFTGGALPSVVEAGQTLRLLDGMSAGDYRIGSVAAASVVVDKATVAVESGRSYNFLADYPHPDLPLLNVDEIRVLTSPGGDATGINLNYRLPVRVEALSASISNGPGVRVASSEGHVGNIAVTLPIVTGEQDYIGTLTWVGHDFREYGCQTGDVLFLDGTYIKGDFYITDLDMSGADGTAEFIYIGTNRNFVMETDTSVGFGVYARNYTNLRLYFEHPLYAEIGRVLMRPISTPNFINSVGLTTFSADGRAYTVNTIDEQVSTIELTAGITVEQAGSPMVVFSGPVADPGVLVDYNIMHKDVLKILTIPLETNAVIPDPINIVGSTLTVEVNGSPRTVTFRGASNPIPLDDTTGYGGVKQQLEAALPVEVEISGPGPYTLTIRSRDRLLITGGGALVYLIGLTTNNVPLCAGEYEIFNILDTNVAAIPESPSLFPDVPVVAAEVICELHRMGRKLVKPMEMGYAYGFYYMDFEAMSLGGGDDHALLAGTTLDIGGEYVLPGFDLSTDKGLVFSVDELAEINVTPYASDVNGDLLGIADKQFQIVYGTVPSVTILQRFLTTEEYRATADDTKAKCKPIMRIGAGPLLSTRTIDKASLVAVLNNRIADTITQRAYITLGDVMSWMAPYGITGTVDTRLIVHYTDMDRQRKLLLTTTATVNKLWHIEAAEELLVSAT